MRSSTRAAAALIAALAGLALTGSAGGATMTLDLNTSNVGPHLVLGERIYFFPPSSISYLRGTVLDDRGQPGNSCIKLFEKPLVAPDFTTEGTMTCPNDPGDGSGGWTWDVHATENQQFKAATWPDESTSAAESNVVTIYTAPEVTWDIGFIGDKKVLNMIVDGDSDEYEGTLELRQGRRLVKSIRVSGDFADIRVPVRRTAGPGKVKSGARFSFMLRPDDLDRWVPMTANGRAARGHQGDAGPVT